MNKDDPSKIRKLLVAQNSRKMERDIAEIETDMLLYREMKNVRTEQVETAQRRVMALKDELQTEVKELRLRRRQLSNLERCLDRAQHAIGQRRTQEMPLRDRHGKVISHGDEVNYDGERRWDPSTGTVKDALDGGTGTVCEFRDRTVSIRLSSDMIIYRYGEQIEIVRKYYSIAYNSDELISITPSDRRMVEDIRNDTSSSSTSSRLSSIGGDSGGGEEHR